MSKKILVIEDDNILQEAIKEALTNGHDFEILQAYDGEAGQSMVESEKPDLILLDLALPKRSGYLLLAALHENDELSKIPVFVLSVIDTESSIGECMGMGAKEYFVKSKYSLSEIVTKVREALE